MQAKLLSCKLDTDVENIAEYERLAATGFLSFPKKSQSCQIAPNVC
jgi:hypothetical protein